MAKGGRYVKDIKGAMREIHPDKPIELYTRSTADKGGGSHYIRLFDEGATLNSIDPGPLMSQWSDIFETLEGILMRATGMAEGVGDEIRQALANLPELIEALARQDEIGAGEKVNALGWGLVTAFSKAVEHIAELEAREGYADTMATVWRDSRDGALYEKSALALGESIEAGLKAWQELRRYESAIEALYREVSDAVENWDVSQSNSQVRANLAWLSNQTDDGFCTVASRHLYEPVPDIEVLVAEAGLRVWQIREALAKGETSRQKLRNMAENTLVDEEIELERLFKAVRDSQSKFHELHESDVVGALAMATEYLTKNEYEAWSEFDRDPTWNSTLAIQQRLRSTRQAILDKLALAPHLNEADADLLEYASDYVRQLSQPESEVPVADQPTPVEEPAEVEVSVEPVALPEVLETEVTPVPAEPKPTPAKPINSDRCWEIYEMVLAIGAIAYCRGRDLTGAPIDVMIQLLEMLGKVSADEAETYGWLISEMADERSVHHALDPLGRGRNELWRSSGGEDLHWLKHRIGQNWFWRMLSKVEGEGLKLAARYGLDAEAVKTVKAERRPRSRR